MSTRPRIAALALVIGTAMTLTACSGGGGGGGGTPSNADIRVMSVGLLSPTASMGGISFPQAINGVKAAAAAINKSGGIDGHKLVVDTCDTKGDPNQSAQCGRTAVNKKDVAVVGTFDPIGAKQLLTVLQAAKIPYIGGLPTSTAEYTNPVSFQFDPGPVLTSSALPQQWKDSGCKLVAGLLPANPGNDQIAAIEVASGKKLGVTVKTALIAPGTADVTSVLSTALADDPDCFTYGGDAQTNVKLILGLKKLGYTGKIITSSGALTPQFLQPLGAAGNGIIVIGSALQAADKDPMVQQFVKEMTTSLGAGNVGPNLNEFGQTGWSSVQLVKQALEKSKEYTAASLLKTIPTMCDVNLGNVYPHISFCKTVTSSTITPRVFNDQWQSFKVENGTYVATDGTWHDDTALYSLTRRSDARRGRSPWAPVPPRPASPPTQHPQSRPLTRIDRRHR